MTSMLYASHTMELGDWVNEHSMTYLQNIIFCFPYIITVASSAVGITVVQVSSLSPTLNISWQTPEDGAAITGYTVHYNKSGGGESIDVQYNTTLLIPSLIADGQPYYITLETHSVLLSGFSQPLLYELCKLLFQYVIIVEAEE